MTYQIDPQFNHGPQSVCILRLSAIGDICHALPVVRTLQQRWPDTRITWVIGKLESDLVGDIPGIEFIIFDKKQGLQAYYQLFRKLRGRRFDVLFHMQMSLRASLASLCISAKIKLGFDRQRANDLQWLFTNKKIAYQPKQHVMDSFFGFTEALGIKEHILQWDIPISAKVKDSVTQFIPAKPYLIISPCSSMAYRNWNMKGYAQVADYISEKHQLPVILTGGSSAVEKNYGIEIERQCKYKPVNLIGKTTLKELLAIIKQATAVISPDSGPAHMATAVNTPVIGLYACTNPDRARPYNSAKWTINSYPEAIKAEYGKTPDELIWGIRVRTEGTMDRITVEQVTSMVDKLLTSVLE
ncbi:MAG: glycosyltransferase family 9 protein [Gammaproteobacteria bacterium]|nr:glycosyltransferase family 9 protein [Gammaproteobacteria bacterium]